MSRAILIILDGCGAGEAPDAHLYNDTGADTLGHLLTAAGKISLPHLECLGLGQLGPFTQIRPVTSPGCYFGKAIPFSSGKDTVTGHWEIAGVIPQNPFSYFPSGFPATIMHEFCSMNHLSGYLGNIAASGTEIINQYGRQHLQTLQPIVYTSADSVFQIACHEKAFGLDQLYRLCVNARTLCDQYNIARVIARPFVEENDRFVRTHNRKDYTMSPPGHTLMERLQEHHIKTIGFGKIPSIYNYHGFDEMIPTTGNSDGMQSLISLVDKNINGFYFINLIDFDMLYGHRRDVAGYVQALCTFDVELGDLLTRLQETDLLIITADHGNDPTFRGSDHTREMIPILAYQKGKKGGKIGELQGFSHISATVFQFLTGKKYSTASSFVNE
jgi:phosphopentomutase